MENASLYQQIIIKFNETLQEISPFKIAVGSRNCKICPGHA